MLFDEATRAGKFAELCEKLTALMEEHRVPGVAVGLLVDGREYLRGLGVTSVENPLPVTEETLFQIGSVTKTFTATALMRLAEQGRLDLEAPVRRYLPDFQVADEATAAAVTVRHLLTHVAGWPGDLFVDTGNGDDAVAKYVAGMAKLEQITPLGELWTYNNAAFVVAGRVLEVVAGKSYEAAVKELLLQPLGMSRSFFFPAEVMIHRFAVGHMLREEGLEIARPWNIPRSSNPAGGLVSTVTDLLRYARFQMGDGRAESGERLLTPESLRLLQTPVVAASNGQRMALSWFIEEVGGVRFAGHGGATFGQMTLFWMAPEQGVALAILTNGQRGNALNTAASAWVRKELLGVAAEQPEPLDLPEAELAPYAGRYEHEGAVIHLEARGNRLIARVIPKQLEVLETKPKEEPPVAAALTGKDRLLILEGPMKGGRGEFLTTSDGRRWLRVGVRAYELKK
ncbi:MAG: serine hydrolase domain-containing protein [Bacillota bacterium]